jgi:hypothetical protein
MISFYIFMGHSNLGRNSLGNVVFRQLGKILYIVYLIAPIIMMIVYANTERGVFMTFVGNSFLGIGHLFLAFIFGFISYLFLEF